MKKNTFVYKFSFLAVMILIAATGCHRETLVQYVPREDLFTISYGKFEDQLIFDNMEYLGEVKPATLYMQDGFFYILSSVSKKVMQFNSYGDLLGIYYNPDTNPAPVFLGEDNNSSPDAGSEEVSLTTRKAVPYSFNLPEMMAVNSDKEFFIVDRVPQDRQVLDPDYRILLNDVVLRFSPQGEFIDYLGQEGQGGTPFPMIKSIHTNSSKDIIVVGQISQGVVVFWFDKNGTLLYKIPVYEKNLPNPYNGTDKQISMILESVIPDVNREVLFVKVDYFESKNDPDTNVNLGLAFSGSFIFEFSIKEAKFTEQYRIPAYIEEGLNNSQMQRPYEFLGISDTGILYFITPIDEGYGVLLYETGSGRSFRSALSVDDDENVFQNVFLSDDGIICALLSSSYQTKVAWWRTDTLMK
ncbi:MAG: hypothetical protein IAA81_10385 [Spirochaetes bacterium]|uniref:Lipoprotein n=1 Tax=Candidatus Gallitreponema excrementavium TaxID=2840840 RepID=A0A9D9HRH1_9SPIR|nr:hypothetical protein [Candidatus Gallitreponema excrementavium]